MVFIVVVFCSLFYPYPVCPFPPNTVFPPCIKRDTWQPLHHNTAQWTQNSEHSRKHSIHYTKANCGEFGGTIVMTGGMPLSQDILLYTVYKMTGYSTQRTVLYTVNIILVQWVQCTVSTLYSEYTVQYTVQWVHCTVSTLYSKYSVQWVQCKVSTLYSEYTVQWVHCTVNTLYSEYNIQWVHSTVSTLHCAVQHCTISTLYGEYTVQFGSCSGSLSHPAVPFRELD